MPYIFVGVEWTTVSLVVSIIALIVTVMGAFAFFSGDRGDRTSGGVTAVIGLLFLIVFGWVYSYSATHYRVPLNMQAMVIDKFNPRIIGGMHPEGITEIPFGSSQMTNWPATTLTQVQVELTPSTKDTIEVKLVVNIYVDTSKADWVAIYRKYGFDWATYQSKILQQRAALKVKDVIKDYTPQDLTLKPTGVSSAVDEGLKNVFKEDGLPVVKAEVANWNYTNQKASEAADDAAIQRSVAQSQLEVARTQQQTALIRATTVVSVSQTYSGAFQQLGITSDSVKGWIYAIEAAKELAATGKPIPTYLFIGGNGGVPIAIDPNSQLPAPTATTAAPQPATKK